MTTLIIPRVGILLLLAAGFLAPATPRAEESPHWSKTGCPACHTDAAPVEGAVNLTAPDAESLCENCHGDRGAARSCRHGSGLAVGDLTIDESLQSSLKDGRVVCSTCHDVVFQCKNARVQYSYQNHGFLRDRTTRHTGQYCAKCHDAEAYSKLNPHTGVAGKPPNSTCMLCHQGIPRSDEAGALQVAFNMQQDLNEMCTGCHDVAPHPRNLFSRERADEWVHFVVPSTEILDNMRRAQTASGIELPLDPQTGKVFCATCHNPHEFKVGGEHGSEERAIEHRLRLHDICQACHDK